MTQPLTRAEIYEHLARLEREGHPRPWEAFEIYMEGKWDFTPGINTLHSSIHGVLPVRLKPQLPPMGERTIRYPEPVQHTLSEGVIYFIACSVSRNYCQAERWVDVAGDYRHLARGRIHLTERNAKAHGMAEAGCDWVEIERVLRGEE